MCTILSACMVFVITRKVKKGRKKKEKIIMKSDELKVTVEEGRFFEKMFIEKKVKPSAFVNDAYNTIEIATRLNCISESSIEAVYIEKIKEDKVKITIEYRKVSVSDLTESEDMKDKIIAVLKYLKYSEDDVKSVSEINSLTWHVIIRDTYDPDESFSKRDEEKSLQKLLWKIFDQIILVTIA